MTTWDPKTLTKPQREALIRLLDGPAQVRSDVAATLLGERLSSPAWRGGCRNPLIRRAGSGGRSFLYELTDSGHDAANTLQHKAQAP